MNDSKANGDDALGRKLAEALSIAERLLDARRKDEKELVEQVDKISGAKTAAATKAKERLRARLQERETERAHAEQILAVLSEVSSLGGGLLERAATLEAEAKAEREIAQRERDEAQKTLEAERAATEADRTAIAAERESWQAERSALQAEREAWRGEKEEMERSLEESAAEAARAMSEIRDEVESKAAQELEPLRKEQAELAHRVEDLQLLVKVKTEMLEKFEQVLGERDASIQSLIADVVEKGEANAHLSENLKALRADYIAKEKAAASHESKATASATIIATLKTQLAKVSEEKQKLEQVLIARSGTIDELQNLIRVLSGDTDVEFDTDDGSIVSLPGGVDVAEFPAAASADGDDTMPAPVDVGSLPDMPTTANTRGDDSEDDGMPDVVIEEDYPPQTGEIARAAAIAAAAHLASQGSSDGDVDVDVSVDDPSVGAASVELPVDTSAADGAAASEPPEEVRSVTTSIDVTGWAEAVDGDDDSAAPVPAMVPQVEDSVEDAFFGLDVSARLESAPLNEEPNAPVTSRSVADDLDLSDISIEEDLAPLDDENVVQKTDALDAYECVGAEEVKLAGILSHQPWRVEEITKLTKLDGVFVRAKLTEFMRAGLIEIVPAK